jgi:hypothetical protein
LHFYDCNVEEYLLGNAQTNFHSDDSVDYRNEMALEEDKALNLMD